MSGAEYGAADSALFAEVEAADKSGDIDEANRAEIRLWVDGPRRSEGAAPVDVRVLALDMNGRGFQTDWSVATRERLEPPALGRLGEVRSPTLVIVGDEDLPHVAVAAGVLESNIPGARRVVIANAAHLPSLERPEDFNRIVRSFLGG